MKIKYFFSPVMVIMLARGMGSKYFKIDSLVSQQKKAGQTEKYYEVTHGDKEGAPGGGVGFLVGLPVLG